MTLRAAEGEHEVRPYVNMTAAAPPNVQTPPLSRPVESLDGVGPARAKVFHRLGVDTAGDLLEYFPRDYQFESSELTIGQLVPEQIQTVRGEVAAVDYIPSRPRPRFEATITDGTGKLALVWFHSAWLRGKVVPGMWIRVQGRVKFFRNLPQMANSKWTPVEQDTARIEETKFRPVYPATMKLPSETIAQIIHDNLDAMLAEVHE